MFICEFHIIYPDHTCFSFLPCPPTYPCALQINKIKLKLNMLSQVCIDHKLTGLWSDSQCPVS